MVHSLIKDVASNALDCHFDAQDHLEWRMMEIQRPIEVLLNVWQAGRQRRGQARRFVVGQGYNHFEMPQTLANPYGVLGELILKQMGLS